MISVVERAAYIGRVRTLAKGCCPILQRDLVGVLIVIGDGRDTRPTSGLGYLKERVA